MRNILDLIVKYYFFLLFLIFEVIAFVLIVQNNYYQQASFFSSANQVAGYFYGLSNQVSGYLYLKTTNEQLAAENAALLGLLSKKVLVLDTIETPDSMHISSTYLKQYAYKSATVINNSTNKRNNYIYLNKGRNFGIEKDMGVITSSGIVGIVKEVSNSYTSVISILHDKTKISAKIQKNGFIGTVIWEGGDYQRGQLKDIPAHVKVEKGDTVITSGHSLIFPEGVMIGVIDDYVLKQGEYFYDINIIFSTDMKKLSHVYLIKNNRKKEMQDLQLLTEKENDE